MDDSRSKLALSRKMLANKSLNRNSRRIEIRRRFPVPDSFVWLVLVDRRTAEGVCATSY
jgi:hypothetical protein